MGSYVLRKLLHSVPVYLGIILLVMACLRVNDPVAAFLGKNPSQESIDALRRDMGLDRPFIVQYASFLADVATLDFVARSWETNQPVGQMLRAAVGPTLMISVPALVLSVSVSLVIALVSAFFRGRPIDRALMFMAVVGMSISILVFVIIGQYVGAYWLTARAGREVFATRWETGWTGAGGPAAWASGWVRYCLLPVLITVAITIGYDSRFFRAVMVEETTKDHIVTAMAKGATRRRIMFVHMLKNAMIPVITHVMITLPFLIAGSIVIEVYFLVPGMGRTLINAINSKDFPVVQAFTAVFAAIFLVSNVVTDVLYALVDPRVRLS